MSQSRSSDRPSSLFRGIREQADRTPDATAVIDDTGTFSYERLLDLTQARRAGIRAIDTTLLAFDAPSACDSVVTVLACLAEDVAYLPLNPRDPAPRKQVVLEASNAASLDSAEPSAATIEPDVAYVLATSGSTGTPKLIPITATNARAFIDWSIAATGLSSSAVIGSVSPLTFDLSVFDVLAGLTSGGTVVLRSAPMLALSSTLRAFRDNGITHVYAVPSAWRLILAESERSSTVLPSLQCVMSAGEPLTPSLQRQLSDFAPDARVLNLYGPVETNVVCSADVTRLRTATVPIGRPVAGAELSILTDTGDVIREGPAVGELLVAGPSVFPGYLWPPSEESFVELDGAVWFRTRDRVRRAEDGTHYYLHRQARSFKHLGYLVDPSEIEAVADETTASAASCAFLQEMPDGSASIVLTLVHATDGERVAVRKAIRAALPSFMWPQHTLVAGDGRYTASGKLDRLWLQCWAQAQLDASARPHDGAPTTGPETEISHGHR